MEKKIEKRLYRIVDANFNRAREGLRVCEDVCRFFYDKRKSTEGYKRVRHRLTAVVKKWDVTRLAAARDTAGDVGRSTSQTELDRRNVKDVFYANSQRAKESLRVLEEMAKLIDTKAARQVKSLRYQVYILEQQALGRIPG